MGGQVEGQALWEEREVARDLVVLEELVVLVLQILAQVALSWMPSVVERVDLEVRWAARVVAQDQVDLAHQAEVRARWVVKAVVLDQALVHRVVDLALWAVRVVVPVQVVQGELVAQVLQTLALVDLLWMPLVEVRVDPVAQAQWAVRVVAQALVDLAHRAEAQVLWVAAVAVPDPALVHQVEDPVLWEVRVEVRDRVVPEELVDLVLQILAQVVHSWTLSVEVREDPAAQARWVAKEAALDPDLQVEVPVQWVAAVAVLGPVLAHQVEDPVQWEVRVVALDQVAPEELVDLDQLTLAQVDPSWTLSVEEKEVPVDQVQWVAKEAVPVLDLQVADPVRWEVKVVVLDLDLAHLAVVQAPWVEKEEVPVQVVQVALVVLDLQILAQVDLSWMPSVAGRVPDAKLI